jgi:hypothetical protein
MEDTGKNWKQIIKSTVDKSTGAKYSLRSFSKDIAMIRGVDWDESFYQRVYQVLDGNVKISEEELELYNYWHETIKDPIKNSVANFRMKQIASKINLLERYVSTGVYNQFTASKLVKEIKSVIKG